MMHLKFPLPAGYFPRFELTPDETLAYKELVTDLVKDTRREYESYVTTQQRHVDGRKWKLAKSKDKLHFYKRRSEYGAAAIGLTGRQNASARHGSSSSSSNGGSFDLARSESESSSSNFSQSTLGHSHAGGHSSSRGLGASRSRVGSVSSSRSGSVTDGEATSASASTPTLGGVHKRLLEPTLLATGVLEGTVDDLVYAFHEPTAEDTKGVAAMVGGGDALVDAVVLHTVKCTKTTYLGLKWKLCRTPGGNRDFCFLEYVGVANDAKGQRYGFKVLESVKLRNCPPFADNSIIRTDVSFCYLFRESGTPGLVDVYMQGAFDSSGDAVTAGGVGDARSTMDMLLEVESCMEIAESKKLAALVAKQAAAPPRAKNGSALCSICRAKPGMLSSHLNCQGCGAVICTKCRMKKTVMTSKRGVSTKLKISCCKICLVNVKETSPFEGEPINTQPPLRALTRKPSATSMRSASNAEQLGGLESTQELALALPVATIANVPPHHLQQQQHQLMLQQQQQHKHHQQQHRIAGSLTDTEYSGSMQSWQSSSVSSSYSDLDDSYGSPPGSQLVVAHKMPAVAESPRARLQYHQQQQQQQPYTPQYAYASLADGTMVAAPPGSNGRRMTPPPPPMPPHMAGPGGAPDMNQHRMGLYNQMLELQMQAERAYNLANQNATFMQRQ